MLKILSAIVFTLALGMPFESVSLGQSSGVRVGPTVEERAPDDDSEQQTKAGKPSSQTRGAETVKSDAKPKKDVALNARNTSSQPAKGPSNQKDQTPAAVSSNGADGSPNGTHPAKSTSDAPVKPVGASTVPTAGASAAVPSGDAKAEKSVDGSALAPMLSGPGSATNPLPPPPPLTAIYRIGTGDVLDIRVLNQPDTRQSTLFTVLSGGVLEYPLLRNPLTVAGMTTDELAAQLIAELRHRGIYDRPQVRVSVREYASHAVIVSGLVNEPGTKILRREAVPLYVVVAEAQPKPEAGRAVIISHKTGQNTTVNLNDPAALSTLVQQGDVINIIARPPEFFYIGGEINSPGQKDFHTGITLTQAILASGGVTRAAGLKVRVSRQGADGRLVSTEFSLQEIEEGRVPDPALQPGDRIEVSRARK